MVAEAAVVDDPLRPNLPIEGGAVGLFDREGKGGTWALRQARSKTCSCKPPEWTTLRIPTGYLTPIEA